MMEDPKTSSWSEWCIFCGGQGWVLDHAYEAYPGDVVKRTCSSCEGRSWGAEKRYNYPQEFPSPDAE